MLLKNFILIRFGQILDSFTFQSVQTATTKVNIISNNQIIEQDMYTHWVSYALPVRCIKVAWAQEFWILHWFIYIKLVTWTALYWGWNTAEAIECHLQLANGPRSLSKWTFAFCLTDNVPNTWCLHSNSHCLIKQSGLEYFGS